MAIYNTTGQQVVPVPPSQESGHGIKFIVIFLVLAVLAGGIFYAVNKTNTTHSDLVAQQNQLRKDVTAQIQDQVSTRLAAMEQQTSQQLEAVKTELDKSAKHLGSQSGELKRAHAMVTELQDQQRKQSEEFQTQLSQKADEQQVGALTQDVSVTKTDLDTTKKSVTSLATDLGMARSELGTLIARNHDDIEYLRQMGERDYFEFTLDKGKPARVAQVGLNLKKTNLKGHRFTVAMTVDDTEVEKKDRSMNEPVIFYVNGSKKAYELVVNQVGPNQVKGYISTPKGVTEVAAR
jgi:vacuolar-type H+-ATPase subunit I/STV1